MFQVFISSISRVRSIRIASNSRFAPPVQIRLYSRLYIDFVCNLVARKICFASGLNTALVFLDVDAVDEFSVLC